MRVCSCLLLLVAAGGACCGHRSDQTQAMRFAELSTERLLAELGADLRVADYVAIQHVLIERGGEVAERLANSFGDLRGRGLEAVLLAYMHVLPAASWRVAGGTLLHALGDDVEETRVAALRLAISHKPVEPEVLTRVRELLHDRQSQPVRYRAAVLFWDRTWGQREEAERLLGDSTTPLHVRVALADAIVSDVLLAESGLTAADALSRLMQAHESAPDEETAVALSVHMDALRRYRDRR